MTTRRKHHNLQSLDTVLPSSSQELPPISVERLPFPCQTIPPHVSNLQECALWQIQTLLSKNTNTTANTATLTTTEEEQSDEEDEYDDAMDDGFVLCDVSVIRRKLLIWHQLFPRIKPFFAVKCNPDAMTIAVLGQYTQYVGFDCASLSEIRLALGASSSSTSACTDDTPENDDDNKNIESSNHACRRCLYANPQRTERDLDVALSLGVHALTFDGPQELHKVYRAYQKMRTTVDLVAHQEPPPPEMILRILVPDETSTVPLGEKFGASPERVESLTNEAVKLGLPIVGISFHCGSGCHDPNAYCEAIGLARDAMDIVDRIQAPLGIQCRLLDIGGGYPGIDGSEDQYGRFVGKASNRTSQQDETIQEEAESTAKIASVAMPLVDKLFPTNDSHVQIISEPGRYFVEAAYAVCCRIYSLRIGKDENGRQRHRHYYIAQGVQGVFKDVLLCGEEFVPVPLQLEASRQENETLCTTTVHGPSSEDFDIVCRDILLPILKVGDWLIFDRMGAYTLSIAARSGQLPIRHVMGAS